MLLCLCREEGTDRQCNADDARKESRFNVRVKSRESETMINKMVSIFVVVVVVVDVMST